MKQSSEYRAGLAQAVKVCEERVQQLKSIPGSLQSMVPPLIARRWEAEYLRDTIRALLEKE